MSNLRFQMGGYTPTNLQQAAFIPTYQGTPLEDAQKYGTDLLNTYRSNITDLTKLDIANAQRKVIEGDAAESARYDQELKSQFESMAKKGDYENMTHQVNELARRHVNNKALKALAESRAVVDQEDELVLKMRAAGKEPLFMQDRASYKTVTYDDKGNPVYNVYKLTAETPLDYQAKKADILNVIKPSLAGMSEKQVNDTIRAIDGYIATGTWKGISNTTIQNQVENALTAYKGTPEYTQERKVDMLKAKELGLEGQAAENWVENEQKRKMKSEGLLRVFSETHPDYMKNWMLAASMDGSTAGNPFIPGVDLGSRLPSPEEALIDVFDPTKYTSQDNQVGVGMVDFALRKANEKPIEERGTPQQQEQYLNLAKAALAWKYKDSNPLSKFYEGDPAKGEADERKYLFSEEVYNATKEFQKNIKERLKFPIKQDYDFETEAGRAMKKADDAAIKTNWQERKFLNLDTNEVFSAQQEGKLNPKFFEAIPNPSNLEATGRTSMVNPYGLFSNDPDFVDATYAMYVDPKTGQSSRFLVAQPATRQDPAKQFTSDLWLSGTQKPFTKVTKSINLGGGKSKNIVYEDLNGQGIKIHKFGDEVIDQIIPDDYEMLYNAIATILQSEVK